MENNYVKVIDGVQYDKCIICGQVSPYPSSQNIETRTGYVEGGGQGCFQPKACDMREKKVIDTPWSSSILG